VSRVRLSYAGENVKGDWRAVLEVGFWVPGFWEGGLTRSLRDGPIRPVFSWRPLLGKAVSRGARFRVRSEFARRRRGGAQRASPGVKFTRGPVLDGVACMETGDEVPPPRGRG